MGKRGPKKGWIEERIKMEREAAASDAYKKGFKAAWALRGIAIGLVAAVIVKLIGAGNGWEAADLIAGGAGILSGAGSVAVSSMG